MAGPSDGKVKLLEAQELISLARNLTKKLNSHDESATQLLLRGRSLQRREESVQELSTALIAHSSVPFLGTTRPEIIRDLQHEKRVLSSLQQEHENLLEAVQENNDAIQYIMRKYRQHSRKLCDLAEQDAACPVLINRFLNSVVKNHVDDLEDMLFLTQEAVRRDDINAEKREDVLRSVEKENTALRSALSIPFFGGLPRQLTEQSTDP